jgi:hypothetical protein
MKRKKNLMDLEIYLDPTPLTPEDMELHKKMMTEIIRSEKVMKELKIGFNPELLPDWALKEMIDAMERILSKFNSHSSMKNKKPKSGKTKFKQISSSKYIAAEPKLKYGKKKK